MTAKTKMGRPGTCPTALIEGIGSKTAAVRFESAKTLVRMSETEPELLYPHFDLFLAMLDHENSILRWNAAQVLAGLASVDSEEKIEAALDKYLSPICGPEMIAAATAMQGAARIALAKPRLAGRLAAAILWVRNAKYKTAECRNVAIGHAIVSLGQFFHLLAGQDAAVAFVTAQLENPRPATRKKAEAFLKARSRQSTVGSRPPSGSRC
ncbi:MAG: hypothetical protein LAQ30_01400 [Acidobacteriia bacterium]|nr:hypothetical protein [Terriglobia bacterium]